MNKKSLLITLLSIIPVFAFAEKFTIAPVVIYNQNNTKAIISGNPQKEIYEELNSYWFKGLLSFEMLKETDYGYVYTILDANKVCTASKSDYLLYGYIQKNEINWFANFKVYKISEYRIVKEIYASDSIERYDRFIKSLTSNLIDELNELCGNDINQKNADAHHPITMKIPVNAYYWSPITKKWNSVITGIVGGSLGLEVYPPMPQFVVKSALINFSGELKFDYTYAFGKKESYPLNLNNIRICTPIYLHTEFNENHSIYFGIGPFYEIELLSIIEKYELQKLVLQNMFGLETIFGYEFNINQIVALKTETSLDMHFANDLYFSVKSGIGISFKVMEKK